MSRMLDKHNIYTMYTFAVIKLLVSCLVSCTSCINTRRYSSHSDTARTTNSTQYKEFYNHNVYIIYMHEELYVPYIYMYLHV